MRVIINDPDQDFTLDDINGFFKVVACRNLKIKKACSVDAKDARIAGMVWAVDAIVHRDIVMSDAVIGQNVWFGGASIGRDFLLDGIRVAGSASIHHVSVRRKTSSNLVGPICEEYRGLLYRTADGIRVHFMPLVDTIEKIEDYINDSDCYSYEKYNAMRTLADGVARFEESER